MLQQTQAVLSWGGCPWLHAQVEGIPLGQPTPVLAVTLESLTLPYTHAGS